VTLLEGGNGRRKMKEGGKGETVPDRVQKDRKNTSARGARKVNDSIMDGAPGRAGHIDEEGGAVDGVSRNTRGILEREKSQLP